MTNFLNNEANSEENVLSVSQLSYALKNLVESTFEQVQVRGEISGAKLHSSGHFYFALKDSTAVLDAVCWRGVMSRLAMTPEDGMEVICTGHLTTYPGRSKYQIVVERMELAGQGALLKLLEDRKRLLAAEGLFDADRKKPLPFLPNCIGIITSPTGAVIQDMLHRLQDRFPREVLLWPVAVQGEGAAAQIAAAIEGFNNLPEDGPIPKPDLLIVARGGGSLEDLWAFNEEIVVRAAAASRIPLISGVGHEPDVTLIDFAADHRAPTPTAAAERAVPVRAEIMAGLRQTALRLERGLTRLVEENTQRFDERLERLIRSPQAYFERSQQTLALLAQRLRHPRERLAQSQLELDSQQHRLQQAIARLIDQAGHRFEQVAGLLKSYSYEATLSRGFALLKTKDGHVLTSVKDCKPGLGVQIGLQDGLVAATIDGGHKPKPTAPKKPTSSQPKLWEV